MAGESTVHITLIEDDREKLGCTSIIERLIKREKQFAVKKERLPIGDYHLTIDGEVTRINTIIERKSLVDLRASFVSGRLNEQLKLMVKARSEGACKEIMFIIEGSLPETIDDIITGSPAYSGLAMMFETWRRKLNIHIIYSSSPNGTGIQLFFCMRALLKYLDYSSKPSVPRGAASSAKIYTSESIHAEKVVKDVAKGVKHIDKWMYFSMFLNMFRGISMERAIDISKKFDHSFSKAIDIAREDEHKFRWMIQDSENTKYKTKVGAPTVELVFSALTGDIASK